MDMHEEALHERHPRAELLDRTAANGAGDGAPVQVFGLEITCDVSPCRAFYKSGIPQRGRRSELLLLLIGI